MTDQKIDKQQPKKKFLQPTFVREWLAIIKNDGLKGLVSKKGWVVVVAFFLFYLIRDSLLYILVPYLATKGLFGC